MTDTRSGKIDWLVGTRWGDATIADASYFYDGGSNVYIYLMGQGAVDSVEITIDFTEEDLYDQ